MVIGMAGQAFGIQSKVGELFLFDFLILNEIGFMAIVALFLAVSAG